MDRFYSLASRLFGYLAFALAVLAPLAVPQSGFADSGSDCAMGCGTTCSAQCDPSDMTCMMNCMASCNADCSAGNTCAQTCGGDSACQAGCCQTACNGVPGCVASCTSFVAPPVPAICPGLLIFDLCGRFDNDPINGPTNCPIYRGCGNAARNCICLWDGANQDCSCPQ